MGSGIVHRFSKCHYVHTLPLPSPCAGAVLDLKLHRTEMIYSHGLDLLSSAPIFNLQDQVNEIVIDSSPPSLPEGEKAL